MYGAILLTALYRCTRCGERVLLGGETTIHKGGLSAVIKTENNSKFNL